MQTGDTLSFGAYRWRVLDIHKDAALILTEAITEQRPYHDEYIIRLVRQPGWLSLKSCKMLRILRFLEEVVRKLKFSNNSTEKFAGICGLSIGAPAL
jgi:hypothetical protein